MSTTTEDKAFWQKQLERLKESGLSRSQYCRDNGINYDRFGYWLKKLLSSSSSAFVPIKVEVSDSLSANILLCTLELRGYTLKVHDISALSFLLERLV
jgi:hypothetical protein